jgi:hypothetical protein
MSKVPDTPSARTTGAYGDTTAGVAQIQAARR